MTDPIIFMPGFLGQADDFDPIHHQLADTRNSQTLLWPKTEPAFNSVATYADWCWLQLSAQLPDQFYIYGYSMGGRILMHWLLHDDFKLRCRGLFIAASHTGLASDQQAARAKQDQLWADRFSREPLAAILPDWYQQPVFSSLSNELKQRLVIKRCQQPANGLGTQLLSASLSGQAEMSTKLNSFEKVCYLVGSLDEKFLNLASQKLAPERIRQIANAGHMAHLENPNDIARAITQQIHHWERD